MERRVFKIDELRASSQGEDLVISGRAVKYGQRSEPNTPKPGCREVIAPGCFAGSLSGDEPIIFDLNHDERALPLATTRNRSLILNDQSDGLYFVARLNSAVQSHRDIHALVRDGTLSQCSFAFGEAADTWSDEYDQENNERFYQRTVRSAKLFGISLVNRPAYSDGATYAEARSRLNAWLESGRRPLSDAEIRKAVEEIGIQLRADQAEYGFMRISTGPRECDCRFIPIDYELMKAIATARGREIEADLARQTAVDAQTELTKRFTEPVTRHPLDPRWGPRSA
jgi:HK97 family phage prohead protease